MSSKIVMNEQVSYREWIQKVNDRKNTNKKLNVYHPINLIIFLAVWLRCEYSWSSLNPYKQKTKFICIIIIIAITINSNRINPTIIWNEVLCFIYISTYSRFRFWNMKHLSDNKYFAQPLPSLHLILHKDFIFV